MTRTRTTLATGAVSLLSAAFLAGCGSPSVHGPAKPSNTAISPGRGRTEAGLSLERLQSLTNYRSRMTNGMGSYHLTIDTRVHSPTDWQVDSPAITRYVDGMRYVDVKSGNYWLAQKPSPGSYAQQNLPSFARQFFDMTRVSGVSLRRGKPCRQAGVDGHIWSVAANGGAAVREAFAACVADSSGALLKLVMGADGAVTDGRHASEVYEIEAIGNVPAFGVPAPIHTD